MPTIETHPSWILTFYHPTYLQLQACVLVGVLSLTIHHGFIEYTTRTCTAHTLTIISVVFLFIASLLTSYYHYRTTTTSKTMAYMGISSLLTMLLPLICVALSIASFILTVTNKISFDENDPSLLPQCASTTTLTITSIALVLSLLSIPSIIITTVYFAFNRILFASAQEDTRIAPSLVPHLQFLKTPYGDIIPFYLLKTTSSSPIATILYAHTNATEITGLFPQLGHLANNLNCDLVAFEYPGFGTARGWPEEKRLLAAIECMYIAIVTNGTPASHDAYQCVDESVLFPASYQTYSVDDTQRYRLYQCKQELTRNQQVARSAQLRQALDEEFKQFVATKERARRQQVQAYYQQQQQQPGMGVNRGAPHSPEYNGIVDHHQHQHQYHPHPALDSPPRGDSFNSHLSHNDHRVGHLPSQDTRGVEQGGTNDSPHTAHGANHPHNSHGDDSTNGTDDDDDDEVTTMTTVADDDPTQDSDARAKSTPDTIHHPTTTTTPATTPSRTYTTPATHTRIHSRRSAPSITLEMAPPSPSHPDSSGANLPIYRSSTMAAGIYDNNNPTRISTSTPTSTPISADHHEPLHRVSTTNPNHPSSATPSKTRSVSRLFSPFRKGPRASLGKAGTTTATAGLSVDTHGGGGGTSGGASDDTLPRPPISHSRSRNQLFSQLSPPFPPSEYSGYHSHPHDHGDFHNDVVPASPNTTKYDTKCVFPELGIDITMNDGFSHGYNDSFAMGMGMDMATDTPPHHIPTPRAYYPSASLSTTNNGSFNLDGDSHDPHHHHSHMNGSGSICGGDVIITSSVDSTTTTTTAAATATGTTATVNVNTNTNTIDDAIQMHNTDTHLQDTPTGIVPTEQSDYPHPHHHSPSPTAITGAATPPTVTGVLTTTNEQTPSLLSMQHSDNDDTTTWVESLSRLSCAKGSGGGGGGGDNDTPFYPPRGDDARFVQGSGAPEDYLSMGHHDFDILSASQEYNALSCDDCDPSSPQFNRMNANNAKYSPRRFQQFLLAAKLKEANHSTRHGVDIPWNVRAASGDSAGLVSSYSSLPTEAVGLSSPPQKVSPPNTHSGLASDDHSPHLLFHTPHTLSLHCPGGSPDLEPILSPQMAFRRSNPASPSSTLQSQLPPPGHPGQHEHGGGGHTRGNSPSSKEPLSRSSQTPCPPGHTANTATTITTSPSTGGKGTSTAAMTTMPPIDATYQGLSPKHADVLLRRLQQVRLTAPPSRGGDYATTPPTTTHHNNNHNHTQSTSHPQPLQSQPMKHTGNPPPHQSPSHPTKPIPTTAPSILHANPFLHSVPTSTAIESAEYQAFLTHLQQYNQTHLRGKAMYCKGPIGVRSSRVVLFGRSLGSALATITASSISRKAEWNNCVLEARRLATVISDAHHEFKTIYSQSAPASPSPSPPVQPSQESLKQSRQRTQPHPCTTAADNTTTTTTPPTLQPAIDPTQPFQKPYVGYCYASSETPQDPLVISLGIISVQKSSDDHEHDDNSSRNGNGNGTGTGDNNDEQQQQQQPSAFSPPPDETHHTSTANHILIPDLSDFDNIHPSSLQPPPWLAQPSHDEYQRQFIEFKLQQCASEQRAKALSSSHHQYDPDTNHHHHHHHSDHLNHPSLAPPPTDPQHRMAAPCTASVTLSQAMTPPFEARPGIDNHTAMTRYQHHGRRSDQQDNDQSPSIHHKSFNLPPRVVHLRLHIDDDDDNDDNDDDNHDDDGHGRYSDQSTTGHPNTASFYVHSPLSLQSPHHAMGDQGDAKNTPGQLAKRKRIAVPNTTTHYAISQRPSNPMANDTTTANVNTHPNPHSNTSTTHGIASLGGVAPSHPDGPTTTMATTTTTATPQHDSNSLDEWPLYTHEDDISFSLVITSLLPEPLFTCGLRIPIITHKTPSTTIPPTLTTDLNKALQQVVDPKVPSMNTMSCVLTAYRYLFSSLPTHIMESIVGNPTAFMKKPPVGSDTATTTATAKGGKHRWDTNTTNTPLASPVASTNSAWKERMLEKRAQQQKRDRALGTQTSPHPHQHPQQQQHPQQRFSPIIENGYHQPLPQALLPPHFHTTTHTAPAYSNLLCLVLECAFTSVLSTLRLANAVGMSCNPRFDVFRSIEAVRDINVPVHQLHGERDGIVPFTHAHDIRKLIHPSCRTELFTVEDGDHNHGLPRYSLLPTTTTSQPVTSGSSASTTTTPQGRNNRNPSSTKRKDNEQINVLTTLYLKKLSTFLINSVIQYNNQIDNIRYHHLREQQRLVRSVSEDHAHIASMLQRAKERNREGCGVSMAVESSLMSIDRNHCGPSALRTAMILLRALLLPDGDWMLYFPEMEAAIRKQSASQHQQQQQPPLSSPSPSPSPSPSSPTSLDEPPSALQPTFALVERNHLFITRGVVPKEPSLFVGMNVVWNAHYTSAPQTG